MENKISQTVMTAVSLKQRGQSTELVHFLVKISNLESSILREKEIIQVSAHFLEARIGWKLSHAMDFCHFRVRVKGNEKTQNHSLE